MKVSVILSTRNAAGTLEKCLKSIKDQTEPAFEIIIVDRDSNDKTKEIAQKFTSLVFNFGSERSAQRNFGVSKAKGDYLLLIDADMELSENVIKEASEFVNRDKEVKAISIPERSFGEGFWAQVKAFERSFYVGEVTLEAPRFIEKAIFKDVGGYDEKLVAGEDWDLANRLRKKEAKFARIQAEILHNEGHLTLFGSARKKYYYGSKIKKYLSKGEFNLNQVSPLRVVFFKDPPRLLKNPFKTLGLIILKVTEFSAGFLGLLSSLISRQRKEI